MFVQTCTVHIFDLWLQNFYFKPRIGALQAKMIELRYFLQESLRIATRMAFAFK